MPLFTEYRRRIVWTLLIVLTLPVWLYGASLLGLLPWSPINCTHQDVDIYSGRVRFTRLLFWQKVHESVEDSALTRALLPEDYARTTPEWHHAITLSPGLRHSPHYIFHSALHQISELELIWKLADFTPAAKRASARRVLQLWQQTGTDDGPKAFLVNLGKLAMDREDNQPPIDESDLQSFEKDSRLPKQ